MRRLASLEQVELMFDSIMESDSWLGVELRHFAALEAVAREGTFGRAAESLGYTQSAISQQIQTLERIVGERLLERPGGPRAVSLTEAGGCCCGMPRRSSPASTPLRRTWLRSPSGESGHAARRNVPERRRQACCPAVMRRFPPRGRSSKARADGVVVGRGPASVDRARRARPRLRDAATLEGPFEAKSCSGMPTCCSSRPSTSSPEARRAASRDVGDLTLIGNRACRSTALAEGELATRGVGLDVAFRSDDNGTVQGLVGAGFGARARPAARDRPE